MDFTEAMSIFVRAAMLPVATLLPLINPPGTAPVFLSMTPGAADSVRARLALRIARHSFTLLVGAVAVGSYCLMLFGLSLASIRIAGGVLVIATAWQLLRSDHSPDAEVAATSAAVPAERLASHSFYPLTFPVTIGPGSLSVAMTLGLAIRSRDVSAVPRMLGALVGIIVVSIAIYLCYRFASRLTRALGSTGSAVLTRLSAFILLSVGVQIVCDGLGERFGLPSLP